MRREKILTTILALGTTAMAATTATTAMAQQNGITVTEVKMTNTAEGPRLEMNVAISPGAVMNLQGIAVVPALADVAGNRATFPPVVVNGKNRGQIYERHEKFGYAEITENPPYVVMNIDAKHPGGNVDYSAPVAREPWMANASLNLAFVLVSPAGERQTYSTTVTGTAEVVALPEAALITTEPTVTLGTTSGAEAPTAAGRIYTAAGSAKPGQEMDETDQAIGRITEIPGATIVGVTITGYSSPEGVYETNAAMAYERVTALARYLQARHGITAAIIKTRAVGEDWSGLRRTVTGRARDWPKEVIGIIDSPDSPDGKETKLRRLAGGKTWQRMEREIFPEMRKTDYSIDYMIN